MMQHTSNDQPEIDNLYANITSLATVNLGSNRMNAVLLLAALICLSSAIGVSNCLEQLEESGNSTEKLDLVTFMASSAAPNQAASSMTAPSSNQKLLTEKCSKQVGGSNANNRRCQKFREREKQAKLGSINDIWNDADMLQHPIDEEPRRMERALGEMCLYSSDCSSGCCMLDRETKIRSCQPKAIQGEKCTTAQIKGDLYVDVCPCESGDSNCVYPGEFCFK